jgi:hypothetical protein
VWWCTPVIPALGKLRQEDCEFQASLDYTVRSCLKKKKKKKKKKPTNKTNKIILFLGNHPHSFYKTRKTRQPLYYKTRMKKENYRPNFHEQNQNYYIKYQAQKHKMITS